MHGRVKVRTSEEESVRKKKEQQLKVKAYRAGMLIINKKRNNNELDVEMLKVTAQILSKNPDIYTLWNIRKECLVKIGNDLEIETKQELFDKDLDFTEQSLMVNPKSYGAWHHRCWVLDNCPMPNWNKEVALCSKYLRLDERNLHCWDYRRFVVSKAGVEPQNELDFCTEKIQKNFSNYSSWHYRSKLLPIVHPHDTNSQRPISETKLKEELEMVLTAAFTDPNDSSAWFYQRWLLGYSQPDLDLAAFRINKNKAVLSFTKPINLVNNSITSNIINDFELIKWTPLSGEAYDTTWISTGVFSFNESGNNEFSLNCKGNKSNYHLKIKKCFDGYFGWKCPSFDYEFGDAVLEELKSQLDSCNQLLEYEPDSKWTLLTASLLMRAINRKEYHKKSLEFLKKLETIDFLRKGYYADLASKWNVEKVLEEWNDSELIPLRLNLSDLGLTSICYGQYCSIADEIDLSKNCLTNRTIPKILSFQFLKSLNISQNKFTPDVKFPDVNFNITYEEVGDNKNILEGDFNITLC